MNNNSAVNLKERNQTFSYLYALAIIMVIDDHCGSRIGFFTSIFPYDSFFMPLFVFCSGYFYKHNNFVSILKHKTKKLLVPYLLWNIVAVIVSLLLEFSIGIKWLHHNGINTFINMFVNSSPTTLNGPAWFILMLFYVSVGYGLIRNIVRPGKISDFLLTAIFFAGGLFGLFLCMNGYCNTERYENYILLFISRTLFYIQFYHYGYMFKKYIECYMQKCVWGIICILINTILVIKVGGKINFSGTEFMGNFSSYYLPVITSFTGILFYYSIMRYLSEKIGQNKYIDFISQNTFVILETHLFFIHIPNFYAYYRFCIGDTRFLDFPVENFLTSAWFSYNNKFCLISFFVGLTGSLLTAFVLKKISAIIKNHFIKERS